MLVMKHFLILAKNFDRNGFLSTFQDIFKTIFMVKNKVFKQSSGFNLGLINDPNMSLIIKAQDDDPNQLFSLR